MIITSKEKVEDDQELDGQRMYRQNQHTRRWSERLKIEELGEAWQSTFWMKKTPDDDE